VNFLWCLDSPLNLCFFSASFIAIFYADWVMKLLSFGPPPSPSAGRKRQQLGTIAANRQEVGTSQKNGNPNSDNDSNSSSDRENSQAARRASRNQRNPGNNKIPGVSNSDKDDAMDIVTASTSTGSMAEASLAEMLLQKNKLPPTSTTPETRPKKRKLAPRKRRAQLHSMQRMTSSA
jgi:hypothetical protein